MKYFWNFSFLLKIIGIHCYLFGISWNFLKVSRLFLKLFLYWNLDWNDTIYQAIYSLLNRTAVARIPPATLTKTLTDKSNRRLSKLDHLPCHLRLRQSYMKDKMKKYDVVATTKRFRRNDGFTVFELNICKNIFVNQTLVFGYRGEKLDFHCKCVDFLHLCICFKI